MTERHSLLNFSFSTESLILRNPPFGEEDFGAKVDVKTWTSWKNSSSCIQVFSRLEFAYSVESLVSWMVQNLDSDSSSAPTRSNWLVMHDSVQHRAIINARVTRRRKR